MRNIFKLIKPARRSRARRARHGSEVLEAALLFPIIAGMVSGLIQYGWYFHVQHTIQGAAREGARYAARASLNGDADAHQTEALSRINSYITAAGIDPNKFNITFDPADTDAMNAGDRITVTISSTWTKVGVPFLFKDILIQGSRPVRGLAVMNKEG